MTHIHPHKEPSTRTALCFRSCAYIYAAGRPIDVRTEDENGTVTSRTTYEYTYANSLFKTKQTVVGDSYAPDVVTTTYKDNMDQTVKTGAAKSYAQIGLQTPSE